MAEASKGCLNPELKTAARLEQFLFYDLKRGKFSCLHLNIKNIKKSYYA